MKSLILLCLFGWMCDAQAQTPVFPISSNGQALTSIVVGANPTARTQAAAATLAQKLGQITGGSFPVVTGDGTSGIVVGVIGDYTAPPVPLTATNRENYTLQSYSYRLLVLGNTELAVENAVWDLLYRLGYRQFFPGPNWEVVPSSPTLGIAVSHAAVPSYPSRLIFAGYGTLSENLGPRNAWLARNRMVQGFKLNTGHAYSILITRNQAAFDAHPEYLCPPGPTVTGTTKFIVSDPGLRQLVIDDALSRFAADPTLDSVSMEPNDGPWSNCAGETIGSPSDRALTLANAVGAAVRATYGPDKRVGMLAYNDHSAPPTIPVDPSVIISPANGFILGGYTLEEVFDGWRNKGATLGFYDYLSVYAFDRDVPGGIVASNLDYVQQSITSRYANGSRFYQGEASNNWGPNGLGYYLAARLLWDVNEAGNIPALKADFFERCFGPIAAVKDAMIAFYDLIDGSNKPLLGDDIVGRMYRRLDEARAANPSAAVLARLNDLVLYTRYVELYLDYVSATGAARQAAFEQVVRHSWRMRGTMMVHSLAVYLALDGLDTAVSIPAGAGYSVPEPANPWKSSVPFSVAEMDGYVTNGIATHALLDFTPVTFSENLVVPTALNIPPIRNGVGNMGPYSRGLRDYHTWFAAPGALTLGVQAGLAYTTYGMARVDLYRAAAPTVSLDHEEAPPDLAINSRTFTSTATGLHHVTVNDNNGTALSWTSGTRMTLLSSLTNRITFNGAWSLYFYVPKAAQVIGGYYSGAGYIFDSNGANVFAFPKKPGYFKVAVPPGQDGKMWRLHTCVGQCYLMTVPPCLTRDRTELLLPAEVVASDSGVASTPQETWRFANFGTTANYGAAADTANPDGDEWSNAQEYTLGTNPAASGTNALLTATASGSNAVLTFTASRASGASYTGLTRTYDVESTTNLSNPASWSPLAGYANIPGTGQTVIVSQALIGPRNFYRLKVRLITQ